MCTGRYTALYLLVRAPFSFRGLSSSTNSGCGPAAPTMPPPVAVELDSYAALASMSMSDKALGDSGSVLERTREADSYHMRERQRGPRGKGDGREPVTVYSQRKDSELLPMRRR